MNLTYEKAKELFAKARYPERGKPVANNTRIFKRAEDCYALRFHETDVATFFEDGRVILNSGGWRTMSTRDRMCYVAGIQVHTDRGTWHVLRGKRGKKTEFDHGDGWSFYYAAEGEDWARVRHYPRVPYFDGIILQRKGNHYVVVNPIDQKTLARRQKLTNKTKKRIRDFCKLAVEKLTEGMPMPSGGDCWYCLFKDKETGESMGDMSPDNDHLWSHIMDGYVVPSLLANALLEAGYKPVGVAMFLSMDLDNQTMGGSRGRYDTAESALYKYLKTRLIPTDDGSTPTGARPRGTYGATR